MPRGPLSTADCRLIQAGTAEGIHVTAYQLERWRALGLVPRNDRRGLGRGRGSVALPQKDAIDCIRTVALASSQGSDIMRNVARCFYDAAFRSTEQAEALAERPVRRALDELVTRHSVARVSEDQAYEEATKEAATDKFIARSSLLYWRQKIQRLSIELRARNAGQPLPPEQRTPLRAMRAAYEHLLAAKRIGVGTVGFDLIEESVINLNWAVPGAAASLVRFLNLTLQRTAEHRRLLSGVQYSQLIRTAETASTLQRANVSFSEHLQSTSFSWMATISSDFEDIVLVHLALLMDETLRHEADAIASNKVLQTELRTSRRRGTPILPPEVLSNLRSQVSPLQQK